MESFNIIWESVGIPCSLNKSYQNLLPLSTAKYNDIKHLSKFCTPKSQQYFTKLPYMLFEYRKVNFRK